MLFCFFVRNRSFNSCRFVFEIMTTKDQLTSLGWSIKSEFFEGNKQRLEEVKRQLLDVSLFLSSSLNHLSFSLDFQSDFRQIGEKSLPEMSKLDQVCRRRIAYSYDFITDISDNKTVHCSIT